MDIKENIRRNSIYLVSIWPFYILGALFLLYVLAFHTATPLPGPAMRFVQENVDFLLWVGSEITKRHYALGTFTALIVWYIIFHFWVAKSMPDKPFRRYFLVGPLWGLVLFFLCSFLWMLVISSSRSVNQAEFHDKSEMRKPASSSYIRN